MKLTSIIERGALIAADKPATICGTRVRTWRQSRDRIARMAGAFKKLGIRSGEPIGILAVNSDWYFEYYFATFWIGALINPMNIRHAIAEIAWCLTQSRTRLLLVDANFAHAVEQLRAEVHCLEHVVYMGEEDAPPGMLGLETLVKTTDAIPDESVGGNQACSILYTGGTTGFPKGVVGSVHSKCSGALLYQSYFRLPWGAASLHFTPMFHGSGLGSTIVGAILSGTLIFLSKFEPREVMSLIEQYRIEWIGGAPVMIKMMLDHPEFQQRDLSSLKKISYGMSPISGPMLRRISEALPGVQLYQVYGQTESGAPATILLPDDHDPRKPTAQRLLSAGQPTLGTEIRIVDESGQDLENGKVGEIWIRSDMNMLRYLDQPDLTAAALSDDGWIRTGDAAWMDADGFVYIVDRVKDMIISGGENIYSAEVERVLGLHPAVDQCAVIGVPDPKWGERVHAIVITREGTAPSADELVAHCRQHIGGYKVPRSVEFRTEPMPISPSGKILKRELRKPYWENEARNVS